MLIASGIRNHTKEGALRLVDIGLGVFLFAIGILGLSVSVMQVSRAGVVIDNGATAEKLAIDGMERALSSNGFDHLRVSDYHVGFPGPGRGGGRRDLKFKRTVTVTESEDSNYKAARRIVTVRVEWLEHGENRSLQLVSSPEDL